MKCLIVINTSTAITLNNNNLPKDIEKVLLSSWFPNAHVVSIMFKKRLGVELGNDVVSQERSFTCTQSLNISAVE